MPLTPNPGAFTALLSLFIGLSVADHSVAAAQEMPQNSPPCQLVKDDFGPEGEVPLQTTQYVNGLKVPWGLAILPDGDMLVTERPGQIRLVKRDGNKGRLVEDPVAKVQATPEAEGGLLGMALHPAFSRNRFFYVYYTTKKDGANVNRVERYRLSKDKGSATPDRIIIDDIPAAQYHDGGRIKFGPDGMLYIGTGDARNPKSAQNKDSPSGKILRLTPEGKVPQDNPIPGNPLFILGVRNTQGFDWTQDGKLVMTDHGPSGELGRRGHDELNFVEKGENLGWPEIYKCQTKSGMSAPAITWKEALPPGGTIIYQGNAVPAWKGSVLIPSLSSRHLQRVQIRTDEGQPRVLSHEVYLKDAFGRLRSIIQADDGSIFITTSNCDGRGDCPPEGDSIIRITGAKTAETAITD